MKKILLVDDEKLNHMIVENFFSHQKNEIQLYHAYSGEEAIEIFKKDSEWDAILLDAIMDGIDGFETAKEIRKIEKTFTPIIMLTGLTNDESRIKAVEAKINDFVTKPIDFFLLQLSLINLFELRRMFQEIQSYQKFYQMLINSLSDPILVFDHNQSLVFINSNAKQLLNELGIKSTENVFQAITTQYPQTKNFYHWFNETLSMKDSYLANSLEIGNFYFQILFIPFSEQKKVIILFKDLTELYLKNKKLQLDLEKKKSEIKKAGYIQKNLLSKPIPKNRRLLIKSIYIPSSSIGGDFQAIYEQESSIAGIIADVSGHGIEAALYTTILYMTTEQNLYLLFDSTALFLDTLDKELSKINLDSNFVTAFVFRLDTKKNVLYYANAGHNIPYYILNNKRQKYPLPMQKGGLPLGLGFNKPYYENKIDFEKNNYRIIFYTDGLVEDFTNANKVNSEERLDNILYSEDWLKELVKFREKQLQLEDHPDVDDTSIIMIEKKRPIKIKARFFEPKNADMIWEKTAFVLDQFDYKTKEKEKIFVIIQELISNAARYGKEGEVVIKINSAWVIIQVKDKGAGFDVQKYFQNSLENKIEVFLQEKLHNYLENDNCGLGLFLVKKYSYKFWFSEKGNNFICVVKKEPQYTEYYSKYDTQAL